MLLTAPPIQPQPFDQILSEALVRIPVHNPEYTNYQNNTDPGVTILQLFAFMADNLSFIANQVPDQNRIKFLNLLGIPMLPPAAASGMVTFSNDRGPLQTVTLPGGLPVLAGTTGFVTSDGLDVLPIEARIYIRAALSQADLAQAQQTYTQLYAAFAGPATALQFYQTQSFDPPASAANLPVANLSDGSIVDRALWIAILTRAVDAGANSAVLDEIAGKTLTLGIMPASDVNELVLPPAAPAGTQPPSPLVYEIATGKLNGAAPVYQRLDSIPDGDPLTVPTLVQLNLPARDSIGNWSLGPLEEGVGDFPPALQDPNVESRLVTWIRVRLPLPSDPQAPAAAVAKFNWAGINSTKVTQEIPVPVELLGSGTGEPDQSFTLRNTPVLTSTLQITIDGVLWQQTDDLFAAPSEVTGGAASRLYIADSASGTVTFGTGVHGARPAAQSKIFAAYSYGGGAGGNVGIGAINSSPQLPAGFKVSNPLPTTGGTAGESIDDAELRIPQFLQNAGRAVSADDFKDIVESTPGIDLGRVEIIPLFQPDTGVSAPGVVTVMVIPNDPSTPQGPVPDRQFLQSVCSYLDPRRLVTTEVHVIGPDYQDLSVSVGFDLVPGQDVAVVREAVKAAVRSFLSPLTGGPAGTGWPLQKPVVDRELLAQAARVDGVSDIRNVSMWDKSGAAITTLSINNLQLPRLVQVGANLGDPEDITQAGTPPAGGPSLVPVPVLPVGC
ncbi:MAG TPA: putative baseplate assembly protein [Bryobacteraceae bacterium]|nr:putative baseplate assembly protein [Bryobacteraceae bacterium]